MHGRSPISTRVRIILADDHELVRVGVRRLLQAHEAIDVVGEAASGEEAVYLVEQERPDIALLDVLMPSLDGIGAAKRIKDFSFETKVVMLTSFEDNDYLERALQSGADGYLAKNLGRQELHEAVSNVMQGRRVFSKSVIAMMQGRKPQTMPERNGGSVSITRREEQILHLVARGLTSPQIAEKLSISSRTVETHRANLMDKTGASNMAGLVRYALLHAAYFSES
ncbi:MAG: response regulator [Candidatus Kapaibacterium sp.]